MTNSRTAGMRVVPPTSNMSSISFFSREASFNACSIGFLVRLIRSDIMELSSACVNSILKGGLFSATKGMLITVLFAEDNAIFASSEASRRVEQSARSLSGFMPNCSDNLSATSSSMRASISSPPSLCSPALASTSKKPDETVSIVTSNVPPPKSYTSTLLSLSSRIPYARAAAVGSLINLRMLRPAISAESLIDCLCPSE